MVILLSRGGEVSVTGGRDRACAIWIFLTCFASRCAVVSSQMVNCRTAVQWILVISIGLSGLEASALTPTSTRTRTKTPTPSFTPTFLPTATPRRCIGDCNHDSQVTVDELVTGVNQALGNNTGSSCT